MRIEPDLCIINYYDAEGRMGLHQDKDEGPESIAAGIPVVSVSIGDTARFLFGGLKRREPVDALPLESGDAFVFGGPARLRYHGVSRITPFTAPPELQLNGPVQSDVPPIRRSMPRVVVVGAGAAGTMAAIFAASERRRHTAARTNERRRTKNSDQRRRPLQHSSRSTGRVAVCHRLVSAYASAHRALVAASRADRVLRARAAAAARRRSGIGQALPAVATRARGARQAARLRAEPGRDTS